MSSFEWTFCVCLLTCLLNWSVSGVKTVQSGVKWIRPDLLSKGSGFFFRDDHTYEDYLVPSFHDRVELRDPQMKDGDASVILKKLNGKDRGRNKFVSVSKRSRNKRTLPDIEGSDQQITVKTGDDVTLQCLDHRGGDIELLEWKRQDLEENVFVWKQGKMSEDPQHTSFKNRVELRDPEMKDGDVSVILKNVTIKDTGTYECYVRNSNTQPPTPQLINTTNLTVTDLGGDKYGGDRVGLIFGLSVVLVLAVFLVVVGFTMYRKSKRLKMQIHQPPADEAAEPELQNLKRSLKEEEE